MSLYISVCYTFFVDQVVSVLKQFEKVPIHYCIILLKFKHDCNFPILTPTRPLIAIFLNTFVKKNR